MTKIEKILGVGILIAMVIAIALSVRPVLVNVSLPANVGGSVSSNAITNSNFSQLVSLDGVIINNKIADVVSRASVPVTLATASTSICAIQSPAATTSLVMFSFLTVGTSTSVGLVVGTTTTAFGTSSSPFIASQTVANQFNTAYNPTLNQGIIGPSQWITMGETGANGYGWYAPSGTCVAEFKTLVAN